MPYVMVPVPEEHVEEVMQFILRVVQRASLEPWDSESVGRLFAEVDEMSRALLGFVARAAVNGEETAEGDAAAMIQLSQREANAIARELNEVARSGNHPGLIQQRTVTEVLPNGRSKEQRVYVMDPDIAKLVADAERADLLGDRAPGT